MIIRAKEGKIIIELNEHEKELSINEDEVTLANRALNRFVNLGLDANRLVLKQNTTSPMQQFHIAVIRSIGI